MLAICISSKGEIEVGGGVALEAGGPGSGRRSTGQSEWDKDREVIRKRDAAVKRLSALHGLTSDRKQPIFLSDNQSGAGAKKSIAVNYKAIEPKDNGLMPRIRSAFAKAKDDLGYASHTAMLAEMPDVNPVQYAEQLKHEHLSTLDRENVKWNVNRSGDNTAVKLKPQKLNASNFRCFALSAEEAGHPFHGNQWTEGMTGKDKALSLPNHIKHPLADKMYELGRKRAKLSQGSWGGKWNAVDKIEDGIEKKLIAQGIAPMVKGQGEMEDAKDALRKIGYQRAAEKGIWDADNLREIESSCAYSLSASTASEVDEIVQSLEKEGRLPENLPAPLKEKMRESLERYFGQISAEKINQFTDKAQEIVENTLKTMEEAREGGATAEVGLNPATARTTMAEFIQGSLGASIGDAMNIDFFLRIAREVVQGGTNFVSQNWDQKRIDEFPALELVRVYERMVPRGTELVHGVPNVENGWDYRWAAACDDAEDDAAAIVFETTGRMIALKSSEVWFSLGEGAGDYEDTLGNPYPPFAFNSGMDVDEVPRVECIAIGLMPDDAKVKGANIDWDDLFHLDVEKILDISTGTEGEPSTATEDAPNDFRGTGEVGLEAGGPGSGRHWLPNFGTPLTKGEPNNCYENARQEYFAQKAAGKNAKYIYGNLYGIEKQTDLQKRVDFGENERRLNGDIKKTGVLVPHAWVEEGGKIYDSTPFKFGEGDYKDLPMRPASEHFQAALYEPIREYNGNNLKTKLTIGPPQLSSRSQALKAAQGNFGHAGRPGERGGSAPKEESSEIKSNINAVSTGRETTDERLGDCYESAFKEASYGKQSRALQAMLEGGDYGPHGPPIVICQGYPTIPEGQPNAGQKMGHAWVEVGPFVVDHGQTFMQRQYYAAGKIDPKEVEAYTTDQAYKEAAKKMTYGPWKLNVKDAVFRKTQGLSDLSPEEKKALDKIDAKYPPYNSEGKDTEERFMSPDGKWTSARARLHDRIDSETRKGVPSSDSPTLVLMGGGPASGKSTVVNSGLVDLPKDRVLIDSDAVKGKFPEYDKMMRYKDNRAAAYCHNESSDVANEIVMPRAFAAKQNVVLDSTGNSRLESVAKKCDEAHAAGFKTQAEYVTCPTEVAVQRAMARAKVTGRMVPETFIRATHKSVSSIFPKAIERGLFDKANLWDTEGEKPILVVSAVGKDITVHDSERWQKFLAKANEGEAVKSRFAMNLRALEAGGDFGHAGRPGERGGSAGHESVKETRTERVSEPTAQEKGHYGNFVLNALAGRNPDQYYEDHKDAIDKTADYMRGKYGPKKGEEIYRGIILDPSEVKDGVVKGVPEIKFVSFSADKEIAKAFGDTKNYMAEFMMKKYPNKEGYLITQTYKPEQLLYHYSWASHLPVNLHDAFGEDAKYTEMQKEVMLKPQSEYRVTKLAPGSSSNKIIGAREFSVDYALQAKKAGYKGIKLQAEEAGHEFHGNQWTGGIDSPAFKTWFGNSKVVNEDGSPAVIYHGTDDDIKAFREAKKDGLYGSGIYFTTNEARAEMYSNFHGLEDEDSKANIMPCYASIQNPFVIDESGDKGTNKLRRAFFALSSQEKTKWLQDNGYDGVKIHWKREDNWVALRPTQVKSIWNKGTWSKETADISARAA